MKGQFSCYFTGRTMKPSKSEKYKYLFVQGEKTDGGIADPTAVEFWSDENYTLKFMEPYSLILDIQGDYVKFVDFAEFEN